MIGPVENVRADVLSPLPVQRQEVEAQRVRMANIQDATADRFKGDDAI